MNVFRCFLLFLVLSPSAYSQIRCIKCNRTWRTKAKYVDHLKDLPPEER